MGSRTKTPEVLDGMIEHVRYEAVKVLLFMEWGNGWCGSLQPELVTLTAESLLEAALLHFRCVIEFLDERTDETDQVAARDYVPDWHWRVSEEVGKVWHLHGRLAHLGKVRTSVASDGNFSWQPWLTEQAPAVLNGFRDFLTRLRTETPERYDLFTQPRADLPAIDLLPILDRLLG